MNKIRGLDDKKSRLLRIGHQILRDALEQHSMEVQQSMTGFDFELHKRIEERMASIRELTRQFKAAYLELITMGGDGEAAEIQDLFKDFVVSGLAIEEDAMFDPDED